MKIKLILCITLSLIFGNNAFAQVGQKITEFEKHFGRPVKEYNDTNPTTKIFIKGELQAQLSHKNGLVTGGAYTVASVVNGTRQPLSESQIDEVYLMNGFSRNDLVAPDPTKFPVIPPGGKITKDARILVMHDKTRHILSVISAAELQSEMKKMIK